ncbi:MAG TPA: cytochrome b/b6 domain-containing protein [Casimicrobiaceae bacterium]|nr:cytochrome b/b6 domain-containing protein [Casimicrobiaceae bacterium]
MAVSERYGSTAIVLHWLTAALIVANAILGLSMVPLPLSPRKLQWYLWHKGIGVTVFLLTALRLAWRSTHEPPPPAPMPAWQQRAALWAHRAMYVLLFLTPLSGWLYSSATGVQVVYLGMVPLPDLVPKDKALASVLRLVHVGLNLAMFTIVCVHVVAAVRHHVVDRDGVLARMLPGLAVRGSAR